MVKNYKISEPFFEYGPKCYMYGETLLKIAKGLDKLSKKYGVDVILDVPDDGCIGAWFPCSDEGRLVFLVTNENDLCVVWNAFEMLNQLFLIHAA